MKLIFITILIMIGNSLKINTFRKMSKKHMYIDQTDPLFNQREQLDDPDLYYPHPPEHANDQSESNDEDDNNENLKFRSYSTMPTFNCGAGVIHVINDFYQSHKPISDFWHFCFTYRGSDKPEMCAMKTFTLINTLLGEATDFVNMWQTCRGKTIPGWGCARAIISNVQGSLGSTTAFDAAKNACSRTNLFKSATRVPPNAKACLEDM